MAEHDTGDFALQNDTKKDEALKVPPVRADTLKDPLTETGLSEAKPKASAASEAKGSSGGDCSRLGDKLPI